MSTLLVGERRQIIVKLNGVDVPEYSGTSSDPAVATIVPGGPVNFVQLLAPGEFTLNLTGGGASGSASFTVTEGEDGGLVITLGEPV